MRTRFFLLLLLIAHLSLQGFIALSIRNFFPRKTLQSFRIVRIRLYVRKIRLKGLRRKPFITIHRRAALECPLPAYPLRCLRRIFFAIRKKIFPKPLILFTVCAEKVYYKIANIYYKLCNARYKVSNKRYKVCNKNSLI